MEHHNKKYVYWLCVIVIAMFVLPCVVARLASECNGMTLCIILFLVLNPVLSYWGLLYLQTRELFASIATLKFARLLNRYLYFSNN